MAVLRLILLIYFNFFFKHLTHTVVCTYKQIHICPLGGACQKIILKNTALIHQPSEPGSVSVDIGIGNFYQVLVEFPAAPLLFLEAWSFFAPKTKFL